MYALSSFWGHMSPTVKLFPDQSQWKGSITLNLKEEIPKNVELSTKGVFIDHIPEEEI